MNEVEKHWEAWVHLVEAAPWIVYWKSTMALPGHSPRGRLVDKDGAWVAEKIFAATVWGFGISDWMHQEASALQRELLRIQKSRPVVGWQNTRAYVWDNEYRERLGIILPCEIADLDRWLESLV